MIYPYRCPQCRLEYDIVKPMSESGKEEKCQYCWKTLERIFTVPYSIGGNPFTKGRNKGFVHIDEKGNKHEIKTRKAWHEAGYSNPLDSPRLPSTIKAEIKRKIEKIRYYDTGVRKTFVMGGKSA